MEYLSIWCISFNSVYIILYSIFIFQVIRDQLRDLSDQLNRMKGHYGDSLNAALNMRTAFNHFKQSVDVSLFYYFKLSLILSDDGLPLLL